MPPDPQTGLKLTEITPALEAEVRGEGVSKLTCFLKGSRKVLAASSSSWRLQANLALVTWLQSPPPALCSLHVSHVPSNPLF
jgi:hypothetical protein